ncbi:MAG: 6-carboxytetrahydropterin synthase, partial [Bacteroidetes bacterium]|nr:6-carboxytetrahydropterin synthase [Bacteroidota bacterium]
MSQIRITKMFTFETGHALYGYDGKCRNVHGHSYKLSVTVLGTPIADKNNVKYGMVIDFTDLKRIVKNEIVDVFDHAT